MNATRLIGTTLAGLVVLTSCVTINVYFPAAAAEKAARAAQEHGLRRAEIQVKGPGSGRDTAVRSIQNTGIEVISIKDVTPVPHNGCRMTKRRRA